MAIVDTLHEPVLVLDANLRIIFASRSFYATFDTTPKLTEGCEVYDIDGGVWDTGAFKEAEREITRLRAMPFDDGRADSRTATIMMNRDGDFNQAFELLTTLLNKKTRGAHGVRRLRALAAARGKRYDDARRDSDYLRSRPGGEDTYQRVEAEIKLAQHDYDGAEAARQKVKAETVQDRLLKARIVEAKGCDVHTPMNLRQALLDEAAIIRAANRAVDEYDFE